MWNRERVMQKKEAFGDYISLIPYTEKVTGITLTGFYYPLDHAELTLGISLGISNELVDDVGVISMGIRRSDRYRIQGLDDQESGIRTAFFAYRLINHGIYARFKDKYNLEGEKTIMANVITDETIDYVGILAKLELSEEEKEQAKKDMAKHAGLYRYVK